MPWADWLNTGTWKIEYGAAPVPICTSTALTFFYIQQLSIVTPSSLSVPCKSLNWVEIVFATMGTHSCRTHNLSRSAYSLEATYVTMEHALQVETSNVIS